MTSPNELGFRIKILTDKGFKAGQTMHVGCYFVGPKIKAGEGQLQTATAPGPVKIGLGYFPNARRSASRGGSPASRIFFWAAAMSYSKRRSSMKPSSAS